MVLKRRVLQRILSKSASFSSSHLCANSFSASAYNVVSPKHLDEYLDELEWWFNNRRNPFLCRETMWQLVSVEPTEYKKLTE